MKDSDSVMESTMLSSNSIDLTIKPLDKTKEETYKEVTQNEICEEHNGSKKQKELDESFEEVIPQNQQQEDDNNGEFELNIVTSKDSLSDNVDDTLRETNIDGGLKLPVSEEKDENYYRLKQGIPRSTKFCSIINIYKRTNRLSSPEVEYNWSRPSTLENKKSKVHKEDKTGKDQEGTLEETLPDKQKQKAIYGEFESLGEDSLANNSKHSLTDNNADNTYDKIDEDCHVNEGIPKNTISNSLFILAKAISEDRNESNTRNDQKDVFEEELHEQQEEDINVEFEVNKVTCEDSLPDNTVCILNDNNANYGSKLLTRDERDGNYYVTQGIPRSKKFGSIINLYESTNRLSAVEDEYNWNLPTEEDPNMILSTKKDSSIITNKKNVGCKRKWRANQKGNGEKDATTSST
ncbi:uncharacterized protein LOC132600161 [Lycium barbarum]|uniref:uncharacterized protein LOC132600161 n=1 Tax=Lycium barbarum TaxID=112863 RepID=UPI00293F78CE|nr:uncharacterized protein LOC132600161 [Lycium barbarum]